MQSKENLMNIAVLASGNGSNFEAIAKAAEQNRIKSKIKLLLTDVESALARERAKKYRIQDVFFNPADYKDKEEFYIKIGEFLKSQDIELVVLAGFMRIVSSWFVSEFRNRILNIHPGLLPSFKGARAIKDAYEYGVKVTGVTVHFVDEKVDSGPIILQEAVEISAEDTPGSLEGKIHHVEHKLYVEAIRLFEDNRLHIKGRRVIIEN